jgi:hypothetical protein
VRFPTLDEVIACNEAVREPDEVSPSADDDDLELVRRALGRAQSEAEPPRRYRATQSAPNAPP